MGCGLALHRAIDTLCLCHRWDFVDVGGQWNGAIGRWDKGHQAQARASDGDGLQQRFSHCFGVWAFCRFLCRYACAMKGVMVQVCAAPDVQCSASRFSL